MRKVKSPKHFLLEKFTKNSLGDLLEIHGEEVTKQLFVAILGREADEEGLQSYADAIGLHQSLIPAIQGLLKSGEFSAKAAALAAPEIVGALYHGILGREADAVDLERQVHQLSHLGRLDKVISGFINSNEFREKYQGITQSIHQSIHAKTLLLNSLIKKQHDSFITDRQISHEELLSKLKQWNDGINSVAVISIHEGSIILHGHGNSPVVKIDNINVKRLQHYLVYFRDIAEANPGFSCSFALALEDVNDDPSLIQFQKPINSNGFLIPDVDFLDCEYYEDARYVDSYAYESKINKAVFIGSTTGGGVLNIKGIKHNPSPRIRSALHFKNYEDVIFELPSICHCDSPETIEYIRSLGIGSELRTWQDQLQYKFILSMDGNGATCSRIAAALMSNSVLCKYDSIHELYYFPLLIPWVHYIPIHEDADVLKVIQMEKKDPGRFREIAENGTAFAKEYLSRESVNKYTSLLLSEYSRLYPDLNMDTLVSHGLPIVHQDDWPKQTVNVSSSIDPAQIIQCLSGHVANHGDHVSADSNTIGIKGSGKELEGVRITLREDLKNDFSYRVRFKNGDYSDWVVMGEYAGTYLQNLPITVLEIKTSDTFNLLYTVSIKCINILGQELQKPPILDVSITDSFENQPLEHIEIEVKRKDASAIASSHQRIHRKVVAIGDSGQKLLHLHQSLRILHENFQEELNEQRLFIEFIEPHMKVLEIGANVGRSTLIIASLLSDPQNLVSFECDPASYRRLIDNRDCNGLTCSCVNAAISERKLIQTGWQTIPSETVMPGWNEVPTMPLSEVREKYPLNFDTLVLDCEGAFYHILKDTPEIMDGITTVIMENDFPELSQKEFVDDAFRSRGLQVKVQEPGPWGPCADRFYEVWKRS